METNSYNKKVNDLIMKNKNSKLRSVTLTVSLFVTCGNNFNTR